LDVGVISQVVGDQVLVRPQGDYAKIGSRIFSKKCFLGRVQDIIGGIQNPVMVVKAEKTAKYAVGDAVFSK
jgi:rRNA processing protein Gar1